MPESFASFNLLGALTANINNLLLILIFICRLMNKPGIEYRLGVIYMLSIFPLSYLLIIALVSEFTGIYYFQVSLMIVFIIVEFLLDYLLKKDFRSDKKYIIPYVTLFYAANGGMIGVASHAGRLWTMTTVTTFLIMTGLSLYMHFKTKT